MNHRESNTAVSSSDHRDLVTCSFRLAVDVFPEKLASSIESLKENVDKVVCEAHHSVDTENGKVDNALSTLDNHLRRRDSA